MKKLLLMIAVLLISGATMAQGSKGKVPKSFLAFHGGPSIPVGDFGRSSLSNDKSGFAKTGFTMNLNYGYNFTKKVGLTGAAYYNRFNLKKGVLLHELPGANVDHWQFYGLNVGPMLNLELSNKVVLDMRVMGGLANANTPKFTYEGTEVVKEDWKWAPVFQGGLDLRFNTGGNVFIFTNADYMWMQPEFKLLSSSGEGATVVDRIHQTIAVTNITGGVGIKF